MKNIKRIIASQHDLHHVGFLVEMINDVYLKSEGDIWIEAHKRITPTRLIEIIKNNELLLAIQNNEVCGCIHLEKVDNQVFKFKMLVANPTYKGMGIGTMLVKFAEEEAVKNGAKTMQLELLVPTEFEHPDKVLLHDWYVRIGYEKIAAHDVDYVHQGISQFLKTACVAKVYQKNLIS